MGKKILRGFSDLYYNVLKENTEEKYAVGEQYVRLLGAQSCTASEQRNEVSVMADDGNYYEESEFKNGELQITVAGMDLADMSTLLGAQMDTQKTELYEGTLDAAPEVALTFSGLLAGTEGYRLFQYFACKLRNVKANDLQTRGQNNEGASVTLTFSFTGRKCDGKFRGMKDVQNKNEMGAFLNGIAPVPSV